MRIIAKFDIDANSREEAIKKAVPEAMVRSVDDFVKDVMAREAMSSTDVGNGIAIPHARSSSVKESFVSFLRLRKEINGVKYLFLLGAKDSEEREYMQMLTQIARTLLVESFIEKLESIKDEKEFKKELERAIKAVEDED
jgi:mannitol/fructose-specific phosphotransferase system IIA component (Ntr-type)